MATAAALRGLGAERFKVLLTIVPPKPSKDGEEARQAIAEAGLPLFAGEIRRAVAFQRQGLARRGRLRGQGPARGRLLARLRRASVWRFCHEPLQEPHREHKHHAPEPERAPSHPRRRPRRATPHRPHRPRPTPLPRRTPPLPRRKRGRPAGKKSKVGKGNQAGSSVRPRATSGRRPAARSASPWDKRLWSKAPGRARVSRLRPGAARRLAQVAWLEFRVAEIPGCGKSVVRVSWRPVFRRSKRSGGSDGQASRRPDRQDE